MKLLDYAKRPVVAAILGAILGLIIGLIWAWEIQPVEWTNVPPTQMGATYQEQYLRMAIDSYQVNPDSCTGPPAFPGTGPGRGSDFDDHPE